jgi:hypothetical protein
MLSPLYGQLSPLRIPTAGINAAQIAADYIAAVEAADGQSLESAVKTAYQNFISGCVTDGIWSAIKASCILAGARTLSGALKPLVGSAPTNFNFVSADYNRKTGLKGNGTTKRLNANRTGNADPQNNRHMSAYRGEDITTTHNGGCLIGAAGTTSVGTNLRNYHLTGATDGYAFRAASISQGSIVANQFTGSAGFQGVSRSTSTLVNYRAPQNQSGTLSVTSGVPGGHGTGVFCLYHSGTPSLYTFSRLSFYSSGESLDLALLDARVTTLINQFAAVIP